MDLQQRAAPATGPDADITVTLSPTEPPPEEEKKKAKAARVRKKFGGVAGERENMERWLLTYCDLITLLMAMFVIMYAHSRVNEGIKGISVEMEHIKNVVAREKAFLPVIPDAELRKIDRLRIQIDSLRRLKRMGPYIHLTKSSKGLIISLPGSLIFDSGSADLKPMAKKVIDDIIAPQLESVPNGIRVEGHTDNRPIHTEAFPSNWHLSTARAISVISYLVQRHHFDQDRFSPLGYGDLHPIASNATAAGRAKNRRVDIVVVYERGGNPNVTGSQ